MGYIGQLDQVILSIVDKLPAGLHQFMVFITNIGSPAVCIVILLTSVIWAYVHKNKRLAFAETALLLAMPLASILKELTKRIRPDTVYVQSMLFKTYSFPSGHAYASFLVCGFFAYLAWKHLGSRRKWPAVAALILVIILVGLSRIYLGAHFPSDVIGGWILAAGVLFLVVKFYQKFPHS